MLLTIDVGNTNTVLGVFDGDDLLEHWRISTDPVRTADELAVMLQGLLSQSALFKVPDISGVALCSTVPSVLHEMREMFRRYYGEVPAVIVEPGVKTGVSVRMDNPKEVGSDRIINSLAAVHLYGGPAIVVDFGTSTNFDAVSERGEFVGGALAPGSAAAEGGAGQAGPRDRQEHGGGTAVRHYFRVCRADRGNRETDGRGTRARRPGLGHDHRYWRPCAADYR
jgi:pantothenate kinase type III